VTYQLREDSQGGAEMVCVGCEIKGQPKTSLTFAIQRQMNPEAKACRWPKLSIDISLELIDASSRRN
jgi:hypothetical protein